MKIFYSKLTGGFYCDEIHGCLRIQTTKADIDTGEIIDSGDQPNPDCMMPVDVVEITSEQHSELLNGQSSGKRIIPGPNGHPILADQPELTPLELKTQTNALIQSQIDALEKGQARAVREAALNIEGAVDRLKALDQKIRVLAGGFVK